MHAVPLPFVYLATRAMCHRVLQLSSDALDAVSRFLHPSIISLPAIRLLSFARHSRQGRWPSAPVRLFARLGIDARILRRIVGKFTMIFHSAERGAWARFSVDLVVSAQP
jgi:hypothetical protein